MPAHPQPSAYVRALDPQRKRNLVRLVELLGRPDRTLVEYHECGLALVALRPADAAYGSAWVPELCGELARRQRALSRSLAYKLIRFAELFSGAKGAARVRELSGAVSWESMMRILPIGNAQTRASLLRAVVKDKLSSRAVIVLIRERSDYSRPRGRRAAPVPSTHPNRALRALCVWASAWPSVSGAWLDGNSSALARAAELPIGQITDAFVNDLAESVRLVRNVENSADKLAEGLMRLLAQLRRKLLDQSVAV